MSTRRRAAFSLSAVLVAGALVALAPGAAQSSPRLQYGNVGVDVQGSDACDVDRTYETMKSMGPLAWTAPVDLRIRGIDVRIPYRGEANALVGTYGLTRTAGARFHAGTDLLADEGEPVRAVANGQIVAVVASRGDFGTYVILRVPVIAPPALPCAVDFYYVHLSRTSVRPGSRVRAGDTLGAVGRTGYENDRAIPTHLHIEMWIGPYERALATRRARTRDIVPLYRWF